MPLNIFISNQITSKSIIQVYFKAIHCKAYPFVSWYPFCAIYEAKMNGNELQRWMMPTKDMPLRLNLWAPAIKSPTLWKATQL